MLIQILILFASIFFLLWSANHLIIGATGIARFYQIPTLFIGLTIVALGTSAPEIMISITAAIEGKGDMAIGNAIGSNIANIGLILGLTALIHPLKIHSSILKREYPILFVIMLFAYSLMIDGYLGRLDGLLLLLGSLILMIYFAQLSRKTKRNDPFVKEIKEAISLSRPLRANLLSLLIGLVLLPLSARYLVNSASAIALWLGVGELIIGLTIVAIGTSLPELITSIVAAIKGEDDIAIGNILGSNMFNMLVVIGFPGLIDPENVNYFILWRDIPFMILLTLGLFLLNCHQGKKIGRLSGSVLVVVYISYLIALIINAIRGF